MELRDAYFSVLHERMKTDPSIFVIVGDFSAFWLETIAKDFPRQYLNAGIAEQNMISIAAGMALEGHKVYVCGQNNFITLRCMDQISVDLCQMNLPVTLVGCTAGYIMSIDGPTHQGITDLGMMMQLPCDIYNCSDDIVTDLVARHTATRPTYVRLGKGEMPSYAGTFDDGFRILRNGTSWIISSGYMVHKAMKVDAGVIDIFRPHPLNAKGLRKLLRGSKIIVAEDNLFGPIHNAICGIFGRCQSIAPQKYVFEYGSIEFLHSKVGI